MTPSAEQVVTLSPLSAPTVPTSSGLLIQRGHHTVSRAGNTGVLCLAVCACPLRNNLAYYIGQVELRIQIDLQKYFRVAVAVNV